jgi:competence ComEA-like helix-hairpin-helix protein
MALLDLEAGALDRAGVEKSGVTSPRSGGGTPKTAPASADRRGLWARLCGSVWTKVLVKCASIGVGMLALAALGASSLAERGHPLPRSSAEPKATASLLGSLAASSAGVKASDSEGAKAKPPAPEQDAGTAAPDAAPPNVTGDGKVILNRADEEALCRLPGIGQKRAQAILALRAKLGGRFKNLSQLLRVKGIGPKALAKLTPHLVLDAPESPPAAKPNARTPEESANLGK